MSQTDRQTNSLTPTIYGGMQIFFFQLNLLPSYWLRSQGDERKKKLFLSTMDKLLQSVQLI